MKVFRPPLRRSWIRHWCGVFESTSTYIGGILTGLLTLLSAKRSLIGACVAFSWPDALPDVKPMVQSLSFPISLISSSLPHFPSWVLTSYLCNFATKNLISFWFTSIYILPFFLWPPHLCTFWGLYWSSFCWSLWTYIDSSRIFPADFEVSQAPGTWRGRSSGAGFFFPIVIVYL